jgi:class 3 adenylate cyclase
VTLLFTDIVGSTAAWEQETAMSAALERHDRIMRGTFGRWSGYVFSVGGDGFGVAFARATEAVGAAVEIQRRLRAERWTTAFAIRVRMGVHTGESIERDGNYFGSAPNRAARLMSAAAGGQIVVSDVTARIVRGQLPDDVALVDLGHHRLRGFAELEPVIGVSASGLDERFPRLRTERTASGTLPRSSMELIGRDVVLDQARRLLVPGGVLTFTGPGGVGKTRLAEELARAVAAEHADGVWWVPLAEVSPDEALVAVADAVGVSGAGADACGAIAAALDGQQLLLVLDNAEHVLDPIRRLVRRLRAVARPVSCVVTSREALGQPDERVLRLSPLTFDAVDSPAVRFVRDRLGLPADHAPHELEALRRIAADVDGLPLALELAAGRCRSLGILETAAALGSSSDLLHDHRRSAARHISLRAESGDEGRGKGDVMEKNRRGRGRDGSDRRPRRSSWPAGAPPPGDRGT